MPRIEYNWMAYAKSLIGVREIAGKKHSPVIIGWLKELKSWVTDDETAWCGTLMAHVMSTKGYALPKNWLSARSWLTFGVECQPGYGAVLVFWRGKPAGWQGHVGLYVGEDDTHYHVLGGNQSDSVSITRIAKARLLGARGADGSMAARAPEIIRLAATAKASLNEA